ncbi:carbohydrate porin [Deminuibacter soli]|uniref:Carbohydrate porin n=1 Tax=Deminuibacter soli TaxID=2291815 RepID=A0A3E1NCT1_9BACT|nr:carbohydrate porin [Deminuibacter soli]RFM25624.1 carbohydrate porin [Deminuibacter soli]
MRKIVIAAALCISACTGVQAQLDSTAIKNGWTMHFQLTAVSQSHPSFKAQYSGPNSLVDSAEKGLLSVTTTLFAGKRLWKNAAVYFNPEIAGGSGMSGAKGIAGFPNGETFRIGNPAPALYVARAYLQQHIALANATYVQANDDINQVQAMIPDRRITISAGKFAISDFYDDNAFSHDPRTQFLNWSLMSNGAWDYPANTRGYTVGLVAELIQPGWAIRLSGVQVPKKANGPELDGKIFKANGETLEFEKSYTLGKRAGTVRLLGFFNTTQAPGYRATIKQTQQGDSTNVPVFTGDADLQHYGGSKWGWGVNANQDISDNTGVFFRASWNDGKTATWAFTEIDRSISGGIHINGNGWKRPNDHIGAAIVVNGISKDHRDFLASGLHGFIIGDGQLNYGSENIAEVYYAAQLFKHVIFSGDYQFVSHPAYNKDRGPVHVFAIRGHIEF